MKTRAESILEWPSVWRRSTYPTWLGRTMAFFFVLMSLVILVQVWRSDLSMILKAEFTAIGMFMAAMAGVMIASSRQLRPNHLSDRVVTARFDEYGRRTESGSVSGIFVPVHPSIPYNAANIILILFLLAPLGLVSFGFGPVYKVLGIIFCAVSLLGIYSVFTILNNRDVVTSVSIGPEGYWAAAAASHVYVPYDSIAAVFPANIGRSGFIRSVIKPEMNLKQINHQRLVLEKLIQKGAVNLNIGTYDIDPAILLKLISDATFNIGETRSRIADGSIIEDMKSSYPNM